jgi:predicted GIY-YIG superfamily endonuclease
MSDDNVLYRMFSATGDLLYVGITSNPHLRFREHQKKQSWWPEVANIGIEHFSSREELAEAERRAITRERPLWNVVRYERPVVERKRRRPPMVDIHDTSGCACLRTRR